MKKKNCIFAKGNYGESHQFHDFFFLKSLSNPYYISFNICEFNCFLDKRFLSFANNNFFEKTTKVLSL